jgi:hypothetical protein
VIWQGLGRLGQCSHDYLVTHRHHSWCGDPVLVLRQAAVDYRYASTVFSKWHFFLFRPNWEGALLIHWVKEESSTSNRSKWLIHFGLV